MLIQWSDAADAYLVILPEWEGHVFNPVTHGATYDEAVRNGAEALAVLIGSFEEDGEPLPEPDVVGSAVASLMDARPLREHGAPDRCH